MIHALINFCKSAVGKFVIFVVVALISCAIIYFLGGNEPLAYITVILVEITAYYAMTTQNLLQQAQKSHIAGIRPLIIATRWSDRGEVGIHAGREGPNNDIHLMNVGLGHASKVHIRIEPPAEAYSISLQSGPTLIEKPINVIHSIEMPMKAKRLWSGKGGFCGPWRMMYAEYEDIEGNTYFTLQSGYSVRTANVNDLGRKRLPDDHEFWKRDPKDTLLDQLDSELQVWATQQEKLYKDRGMQ